MLKCVIESWDHKNVLFGWNCKISSSSSPAAMVRYTFYFSTKINLLKPLSSLAAQLSLLQEYRKMQRLNDLVQGHTHKISGKAGK